MTRTAAPTAATVSPGGDSNRTDTTRSSRLLFLGIGASALAIVASVLWIQNRNEPGSVPQQVTAVYIEAWNARDAQAVSGMTCLWQPAFTAASEVELQFATKPGDAPFVTDYKVTATETVTLLNRQDQAVHIQYVPGDEPGKTRAAIVYVRLDDDHDP